MSHFVNVNEGYGLSYSMVGQEAALPLVFLHGIMGNKKNLSSFVRALIAECPKYQAFIFDLRNHGQSSKGLWPCTVKACADDIVEACTLLSIEPKAIIGHSFGGKVALLTASRLPRLEQVWMLDCPPGPIKNVQALKTGTVVSAFDIVDILASLDWPVSSRSELVERLLKRGVSQEIAAWMTTNLNPVAEGLKLAFDPADIKKMLFDFIGLDCWPLLATFDEALELHVVAAKSGQRLSEKDRDQLSACRPRTGFFHELDAGHFLHHDNPKGLIDIMKNQLPPRR